MQGFTRVARTFSWSVAAFAALSISSIPAQTIGKSVIPNPLPPGVEKIGSIVFDKDTVRPARVEDSALSAIEEAVKPLKNAPGKKLVLVGKADLKRDISAQNTGMERDEEDTTGRDVRWKDLRPIERSTPSGASRITIKSIRRASSLPRTITTITSTDKP